jgi:hypothetical protein
VNKICYSVQSIEDLSDEESASVMLFVRNHITVEYKKHLQLFYSIRPLMSYDTNLDLFCSKFALGMLIAFFQR